MKLSDGVEWGLHSAALLAVIPPNAVLPGKALAEYHGISESYLVKHLQALTAAGILISVPGPKGGYRLARPAAEITVLEIVDAIEGREPAFRCTEIRQRGPAGLEPDIYRLPCTINAMMLRAETAWRKSLQAQTVADIVAGLSKRVDSRAVEKTITWFQEHVRN
ncbi:MAG TPA: Rrf2 family transcriptional regulator [Ktedonobacterales bacterium]|nr:Rrf2 family transcriptional regulator [Ktedonobacterales bacterium]